MDQAFHEHLYDCLIDTGAARSLLRLRIFLELCSKVNRIPIIANVDYNLVSISGDCLQVIGKSEIKFDNMPALSFDIVKDLPHDVILGYKNLQRGQGIISIPDRKLYWFDQTWPICCQTDFALAGIWLVLLLRQEIKEIKEFIIFVLNMLLYFLIPSEIVK